MKEAKFHSNFATVTVCVNGAPVSVHAEVEVTLKKPTKLSKQDETAWAMLKQGTDSVSVELIPTAA